MSSLTQGETNPPEPSRYWQASEKGNGIGLSIVADADGERTIWFWVLPKLWRGTMRPEKPEEIVIRIAESDLQSLEDDGPLDVFLFEGDWVQLPEEYRLDEGVVDSATDDSDIAVTDDDTEEGAKDPLWKDFLNPKIPGGIIAFNEYENCWAKEFRPKSVTERQQDPRRIAWGYLIAAKKISPSNFDPQNSQIAN